MRCRKPRGDGIPEVRRPSSSRPSNTGRLLPPPPPPACAGTVLSEHSEPHLMVVFLTAGFGGLVVKNVR